MKMQFFSLLLTLILAGCSLSSLEDFHHEGESRCRKLVKELQQIKTSEELLQAEGVLKKHFESLVGLMLEAKQFQRDHEDAESMSGMQNIVSQVLKEELQRIYAIEGGRVVIERAQHEALVRLAVK